MDSLVLCWFFSQFAHWFRINAVQPTNPDLQVLRVGRILARQTAAFTAVRNLRLASR